MVLDDNQRRFDAPAADDRSGDVGAARRAAAARSPCIGKSAVPGALVRALLPAKTIALSPRAGLCSRSGSAASTGRRL